MKQKWSHIIFFMALLGATTFTAGCAKSGENDENTLQSQSNTQIETQETGVSQMQTTAEESTADIEGAVKSSIVNPIKKATEEELENMGISISLPINENWISEPSYSIINGETAQINYSDKIAGAEVTLRAGKKDIPTIAGTYYPFDASREEKWQARNIEGEENIDIRVQYAVSDQNQAGVLLSFSYNDFNYTLWSPITDKNVELSSIAKTAVYIAERVK